MQDKFWVAGIRYSQIKVFVLVGGRRRRLVHRFVVPVSIWELITSMDDMSYFAFVPRLVSYVLARPRHFLRLSHNLVYTTGIRSFVLRHWARKNSVLMAGEANATAVRPSRDAIVLIGQDGCGGAMLHPCSLPKPLG